MKKHTSSPAILLAVCIISIQPEYSHASAFNEPGARTLSATVQCLALITMFICYDCYTKNAKYARGLILENNDIPHYLREPHVSDRSLIKVNHQPLIYLPRIIAPKTTAAESQLCTYNTPQWNKLPYWTRILSVCGNKIYAQNKDFSSAPVQVLQYAGLRPWIATFLDPLYHTVNTVVHVKPHKSLNHFYQPLYSFAGSYRIDNTSPTAISQQRNEILSKVLASVRSQRVFQQDTYKIHSAKLHTIALCSTETGKVVQYTENLPNDLTLHVCFELDGTTQADQQHTEQHSILLEIIRQFNKETERHFWEKGSQEEQVMRTFMIPFVVTLHKGLPLLFSYFMYNQSRYFSQHKRHSTNHYHLPTLT